MKSIAAGPLREEDFFFFFGGGGDFYLLAAGFFSPTLLPDFLLLFLVGKSLGCHFC